MSSTSINALHLTYWTRRCMCLCDVECKLITGSSGKMHRFSIRSTSRKIFLFMNTFNTFMHYFGVVSWSRLLFFLRLPITDGLYCKNSKASEDNCPCYFFLYQRSKFALHYFSQLLAGIYFKVAIFCHKSCILSWFASYKLVKPLWRILNLIMALEPSNNFMQKNCFVSSHLVVFFFILSLVVIKDIFP